MDQRLNIDRVRLALNELGWQQGDLARALGASDASISQWLNGEHLPRPGTLLKLAKVLREPLEHLLVVPQADLADMPHIAFRRKGQQRTTEFNEEDALSQAFALERVADYLPRRTFRPREFQDATTAYEHVESLAALVRAEVLENAPGVETPTWQDLVSWFAKNNAVLIPVFWGERRHHGNALHVFLPSSGQTFVYINLDSEELDFKFWLAHEMAHMLTPSLVGQDEGEDFADAFAGSLLFPRDFAARAYSDVLDSRSQSEALSILRHHAIKASVSLNTVYRQCMSLAKANGARPLDIPVDRLHQHRRILDRSVGKMRDRLFEGQPSAGSYVAVCRDSFKSPFFDALFDYLKTSAEGPAFVSRVLHCSIADAVTLRALIGGAPDERHPS